MCGRNCTPASPGWSFPSGWVSVPGPARAVVSPRVLSCRSGHRVPWGLPIYQPIFVPWDTPCTPKRTGPDLGLRATLKGGSYTWEAAILGKWDVMEIRVLSDIPGVKCALKDDSGGFPALLAPPTQSQTTSDSSSLLQRPREIPRARPPACCPQYGPHESRGRGQCWPGWWDEHVQWT